MAWTTNPYATLAQVKAALDLQSTRDDTWLQELIDEAREEIDRYVGYPFQTDGTLLTPATRVYDGNDTEQLMIDPCISITQVQETTYNLVLSVGGMFTQGNPQTLDITADVILGPNNTNPGYLVSRLTELPFQRGRQNYKITGVFGYASVPGAITRACVRLVVHWYKMRDTNYADTMSEQGAVRQKYYKQLPLDVTELLTQYRRRLFLAW